MKTKIFYGNQYVDKFNATGSKRDCHGITKWQIFCYKTAKWYKRTLLVGALVSVVGWAYVFGTMTTMAQADSKVIYVQSTSTPAVMIRIAHCESNGSQLNKSGQVLINVNTNGTTDIGEYQINSVHNAEATKLGYDLTKKADNEAYALYLYENRGTGDWASSSKCWQ
jgi:hypothetical protein